MTRRQLDPSGLKLDAIGLTARALARRGHSRANRVLQPGTQPGSAPARTSTSRNPPRTMCRASMYFLFGVSRTDAGRDVLRQRRRGSSRPGGTCGRRPSGPRQSQAIGGLRDVPFHRRGCMITTQRPPVPAWPVRLEATARDQRVARSARGDGQHRVRDQRRSQSPPPPANE